MTITTDSQPTVDRVVEERFRPHKGTSKSFALVAAHLNKASDYSARADHRVKLNQTADALEYAQLARMHAELARTIAETANGVFAQ